MTRKFLSLVLISLLLTLASHKTQSVRLPPPMAAESSTPSEPKEEEIKAATPEDPGPIATLVSPMAVWQREAERKANKTYLQEKLVEASAPPPRPQPTLQPTDHVDTTPQPADHVDVVPTPHPENFLHGRFALKNYTEFAFVIPPNQASPRLHGRFRSWAAGTGDVVNVDLLLLNDQEFADFRQGRAGSSTYQVEAAHNQAVDYAIASTLGQAHPYHLVFRSSAGSLKTTVDADFTLSFE
jgi:hypothetical protein